MSCTELHQLAMAECLHGKMVWPKADDTIGRSLELYGEFAEGENRLMARYVEPGHTVVDVGANLGTTVLSLAKAVGSTGSVIAFEPQPLLAQCLQTNLTINECFNTRVFTCALAHRSGWARMAAPGVSQGCNYGSVSLGKEGLQVPVMRLDDFELPALALLKVDVEGFEWQVIRGAREHLLRHRPVLYLEAKRIAGTTAYLDWLLQNDWRCYWHFAFFYRKDNFRGEPKNVFGQTGDMNVLAIPGNANGPEDLPEIRAADEDWQRVYACFFEERGLEMR